MREWDWIGNAHLIFSLKPKPIVFVGTKRKDKQGIYTHTHKKNLKLNFEKKNIDELIMVMMREKFNFTGKNDNEEITHEFFESTTISKNFNTKKK